MKPLFVVVIGLGPDQDAGMGHAVEHSFVQEFIAHAAIKTFDKAVFASIGWPGRCSVS